jgi:putative copper export protein
MHLFIGHLICLIICMLVILCSLIVVLMRAQRRREWDGVIIVTALAALAGSVGHAMVDAARMDTPYMNALRVVTTVLLIALTIAIVRLSARPRGREHADRGVQ